MALGISRQGQLYVATESTQGTTPTLLATHALRHLSVEMPFDNKNRETVAFKKVSPGVSVDSRGDRRVSAAFTLESLLWNSGVLNTLSEVDPVLAAAFGSKTNVTLSTTFSGTPTTTTGTIASATGLAVGDFVLITCPDGKRRLRKVTTATTSLVWTPALPSGQAPIAGAACKGVTTYKLSSLLTATLSLAHYLKKTDYSTSHLKRVISMAGVDKLDLTFNANAEPKFKASGEGKQVLDAPSQPGGFTVVGVMPVSGIVGDMQIGTTALKFLELGISLSNGLYWRKDEYGDASAVEMFRAKRREVSLSLKVHLEDEATLYDLAEAGTNAGLFMQHGYTEGRCWALHCPQVEFKVPSTSDGDEVVDQDYTGMALESADGANDEITISHG